jgi:hypothetical protein
MAHEKNKHLINILFNKSFQFVIQSQMFYSGRRPADLGAGEQLVSQRLRDPVAGHRLSHLSGLTWIKDY